jgi:hypothetical protein
MKARDFDEKFDAGEDVSRGVDWAKARRPDLELRRVNVDFPAWVVEGLDREGLDREARRLGVTRQALVKLRIAERLERVEPTALRRNRAGVDADHSSSKDGRPSGRPFDRVLPGGTAAAA